MSDNVSNQEKQSEELVIPVEGGDGPESTDEKNEEASRSEDYLEQLQRLQAEFANYRKRTDKEKESLSIYIRGNLITNLLPVLDDLDLLIQHHQEDHQCPTEAVQMIVQKMKKIFADEGLETIPSLKQPFNPEMHEALAVADISDPDQDGIVIEEWQKGYQFHGNLLRPSRVKVGKFKTQEEL